MNKAKNILFTVVILVLIFLFFYKLIYYKNCDGNKYFNDISFHGQVTAKYLDHQQHSIPVIDILDQNTKHIQTIEFFLDISGSYDKIKVSDVIFKEHDSMEIYIIKNGKSFFLTKIDFKCQD